MPTPMVLPGQLQIGAFASSYPKALALGLSTHPPIGALAPGVCLPVPAKTMSSGLSSKGLRKLILPFALASTLITSCEPPKPIPKTAAPNTQDVQVTYK
jgi:hypothetical protein